VTTFPTGLKKLLFRKRLHTLSLNHLIIILNAAKTVQNSNGSILNQTETRQRAKELANCETRKES